MDLPTITNTHNLTPSPSPDKKLRQATEDFESLFVTEMLRKAREASGGGWLGSDSSAGSDGIMEFAEQNIAKSITQRGGFGIAKMLQKAMAARTQGA